MDDIMYLSTEEKQSFSLGYEADFAEKVVAALNKKVDKADGMGLSKNSFTDEEKEKLKGLSNYDDTELKEQINSIIPQFVFGSEIAAVEYFIEHPDTKAGIIVSIRSGTLLNYRFNLYSFGGVITTQPDGNTGVLLNEITPTQMENKNNKVTSIDDNDSEKNYPSVKAVVNYVTEKIGTAVSSAWEAAYFAGSANQRVAYWNEFQNNGERDDYSYAFANWKAKEISPEYPINADRIMYAFMNCTELEDGSNIEINITNGNPQMMYVFSNCAKMIKSPEITYVAAIVKTYISMYAGCQSLESVKVYWGNGTADPVTQRNSCQNMFFKCYSLKEIDFGTENTGSPLNLDLSYAAELSNASVSSLLNSLQTIPEGSSGKYEIILATQTVERLNIEAPELLDGFSQKWWTITSKDNQPEESEE